MSKALLKKYLGSLNKAEIIQIVLDLYEARKEAKEYLEYFINPNEQRKMEEYKQIIENEFYPKRGFPKCSFSVCRKAIADYRKLHPSPENLGDLMIFFVEQACMLTHEYGDMEEQYYTSTENNFNAAMKHLAKNRIIEQFDNRIETILKHADTCGYGFSETMPEIYHKYADAQG